MAGKGKSLALVKQQAAKQQHPSQPERDAARQYLEHDHASQSLKGESAKAANRHAQQLDEKHPRARDIALTGTARELGILPKHLRSHQLSERRKAGISTEQAASMRQQYRQPPTPENGSGPPSGGNSPQPAQQGLAGAVIGGSVSALDTLDNTEWGGLVMETFAWGVGLSLFYLFLEHAAVAGKLTEGIANGVRAIVAVNVDPLNPGKQSLVPLVGLDVEPKTK